jgi:hypothetical protein
MRTHAYDVSVQFIAEIWAAAKTEKNIKNAIGLATSSRSSDILYSTALRVVILRLEETGQGSQGAQRHFIRFEGLIPESRPLVMEVLPSR